MDDARTASLTSMEVPTTRVAEGAVKATHENVVWALVREIKKRQELNFTTSDIAELLNLPVGKVSVHAGLQKLHPDLVRFLRPDWTDKEYCLMPIVGAALARLLPEDQLIVAKRYFASGGVSIHTLNSWVGEILSRQEKCRARGLSALSVAVRHLVVADSHLTDLGKAGIQRLTGPDELKSLNLKLAEVKAALERIELLLMK